MTLMSINGRKLHYEVHGRGEPIILLHHGFGCTKIWKDIYPPLADQGWQVIMYDRPGLRPGAPQLCCGVAAQDNPVL